MKSFMRTCRQMAKKMNGHKVNTLATDSHKNQYTRKTHMFTPGA